MSGSAPSTRFAPDVGRRDHPADPGTHERAVERLLYRMETPPWSAVYRFAIGFAVVPVFSLGRPGGSADWLVVAFFLTVMAALRVVPAIMRGVLPFSQAARTHWARRRRLAKRYDSYQWRKLLWIGVGLWAYLMLTGRPGVAESALAIACLATGGAGTVIWRYRARTAEAHRSGERPGRQ